MFTRQPCENTIVRVARLSCRRLKNMQHEESTIVSGQQNLEINSSVQRYCDDRQVSYATKKQSGKKRASILPALSLSVSMLSPVTVVKSDIKSYMPCLE